MAIKKERKKFQDYTLDERKDIWNTLHDALDEGGHDILTQDVIPNLPDDEKEYMETEQFHGIAFDSNNFKDVYTVHILNGNTLDAGESIDFDAILEQGKKNKPQETILQETTMDKSKTMKTSFPETLKINGEEWYLVDMVDGVEYRPQSMNYEDNWLEVSKDNCFYLYMDHRIVSQKEDVSGNVVSALREFVKDISKSVKKNGMTIDDPDFEEVEERMDELEYELWREPSAKVSWDKLKEYDELYTRYHGSHFVGSPELFDNADARDMVDAYCGYVAWSNHGNEAHWMEFPDSIFNVYLNPQEILDMMEEQGDMEYYDSDENVKAIVDRLRSIKKGKNMKQKTTKAQMFYGAFGGDDDKYYKEIVDLADRYCPHATKIYAGFSVDVVWDLPSGNHPGLFINEHGNEGRTFFTCGMTAWKYIDFPENTPDGKMPAEMEALAHQMYEQSNGGGLSENDLANYMQQMDELCARLQNVQKSKTKKSLDNYTQINVSRGGGDNGKNWDLMDFCLELEDKGEDSALDDLYNKADAGQERFTLHFDNWDYDCVLIKSKTKKDEKKVPISDDDTVEIEEMDGEKYVEIEPKEEHAEEVETGYEKESDDLNTEDNVTHPDESKPKETEKSKTMKFDLDTLIDNIRFDCQVDDYTIEEENGHQIMVFSILDSDCDDYFGTYDIQQKDGYNRIDLTALTKSKTEKSLIDFEEGMTLKDFFDRNKKGGNSIQGFDSYSLRLDGKQIATNFTGIKEDYMDYVVDSYEMDDYLGLLDINIRKSVKSAGELTPEQAVQKLAKYQRENKRNGLMQDEVYELTGFNAETLFQPMLRKGRVRRIKCADGFMYDIKG